MDKEILKELKKLKKDINPRPEWIALSRDVLLKEINPQDQYQQEDVGFSGYLKVFNQIFKQRILEPAVVMLLVLGVFLGSSLSINAAFYSLPGEQLYPVKIALEKTHVALIPDEQKKVELKIEFAQKRLAEFDKIVAEVDVKPEDKKKKIEAVVQEFQKSVVAVNDQLNKIKDEESVSPISREHTVRMAVTVSSKTEALARSFDKTVEGLSEDEKSEVDEIVAEAVQTTQETNLSAQQLIEDAEAEAEEDVEVADNVNNEADLEAANPEDTTLKVDPEDTEENETVEASTVTNNESEIDTTVADTETADEIE